MYNIKLTGTLLKIEFASLVLDDRRNNLCCYSLPLLGPLLKILCQIENYGINGTFSDTLLCDGAMRDEKMFLKNWISLKIKRKLYFMASKLCCVIKSLIRSQVII